MTQLVVEEQNADSKERHDLFNNQLSLGDPQSSLDRLAYTSKSSAIYSRSNFFDLRLTDGQQIRLYKENVDHSRTMMENHEHSI